MFACGTALRKCRRRPITLWAAALTHKIKRSHCYFSPAVVIGLQCGSIRDCTVPISPSTLRLGGQQWRRREKRRKRQRRRRRSAGRRSRQAVTDLRHLECRRSRHTGPASVEVDRRFATTGRLRWRRGAPAGCGLRNSSSLSATARGDSFNLTLAGAPAVLLLSHLAEALGVLAVSSRNYHRRRGSRRRFFIRACAVWSC